MTATTSPKDLTSIVLALIVLVVMFVSSYWVMEPFLPALIWAAMIVIASWGVMLKVQSKLWGSRSLAVFVMTSILILLLLLPLTIGILTVVQNIDLIKTFAQGVLAHGLPEPPDWLGGVPVIGAKLVKGWQDVAAIGKDEVLAKLSPYVGTTLAWLVQRIGSFGQILVHFLLTIILAAILYSKGESAANGIRLFARRLAQERAEKAMVLAGQAIRAVANGVILTALVQAFMSFLGMLVVGVPYAVVLSSLVFLLGVIQIGAGPVLIGSIIWLFYTSQTIAAWIFIVWSILIMITDNFLRPFLIKRGADLPLIVIFAGVIGGMLSFGIIGIFVGPVVLAVSYTWMQAWIDEGLRAHNQ